WTEDGIRNLTYFQYFGSTQATDDKSLHSWSSVQAPTSDRFQAGSREISRVLRQSQRLYVGYILPLILLFVRPAFGDRSHVSLLIYRLRLTGHWHHLIEQAGEPVRDLNSQLAVQCCNKVQGRLLWTYSWFVFCSLLLLA